MRLTPSRSAFALLILAFGIVQPRPSQADQVYLALGDSATFGYDPSNPNSLVPSYGDQGFVKPFADFLGQLNGGVRPIVDNLAISGELSTSFFDANPPADWPNRWWQGNLNYSDGTTPQNDLMQSTIAAEHAAGNSISDVSLLFGANDIFHLIGTAAFQSASATDQQQMLAATIGTILGNYLTALTELTSLAPEAHIFLPGYYNPFPSSDPADHAFYDSIVLPFNQAVASDAAAFGATYVDLYTPFLGNELALTNIGMGDVHPNQAGYNVIAGQLDASAVPEPSSVVLLVSGLAGVIGFRFRKRIFRVDSR